jgi:hypothetical protein
MLKLSGTSSGKNNKSCRIIHHESKKIGFHFSDFSMIFYAIYKKRPNHFTIGVNLLQGGPRKESVFCNVVPRGAAGGAPVKFRPVGRRSSPGEGGEEV